MMMEPLMTTWKKSVKKQDRKVVGYSEPSTQEMLSFCAKCSNHWYNPTWTIARSYGRPKRALRWRK